MEIVLIVDDEPLVLLMAEAILRQAGYSVTTALDAVEAVELCRNGQLKPRLLIADASMPGVNGAQLVVSVREFCPDIAVMFMSGWDYEVLRSRGVLTPDSIFLSKPFTADQLRDAVDLALGRAPS